MHDNIPAEWQDIDWQETEYNDGAVVLLGEQDNVWYGAIVSFQDGMFVPVFRSCSALDDDDALDAFSDSTQDTNIASTYDEYACNEYIDCVNTIYALCGME